MHGTGAQSADCYSNNRQRNIKMPMLNSSQTERNSTGKSRQPWLGLVLLTGLFNFIDLDYTLFALPNIPGSFEQNPVFWKLLQTPPLAVAFKVIAVPFLLCIMYRCRGCMTSRIGILLCFSVYAFNFFCQATVLVSYYLL